MSKFHPTGERREALPPSDALLARVAAVTDLLIDRGMSKEIATKTMAQRMIEAGVQGSPENCFTSIQGWRAAFSNGAATKDALREYQNVVDAIQSLPTKDRLEHVLGNELWQRRHLNLHSKASECLIY